MHLPFMLKISITIIIRSSIIDSEVFQSADLISLPRTHNLLWPFRHLKIATTIRMAVSATDQGNLLTRPETDLDYVFVHWISIRIGHSCWDVKGVFVFNVGPCCWSSKSNAWNPNWASIWVSYKPFVIYFARFGNAQHKTYCPMVIRPL